MSIRMLPTSKGPCKLERGEMRRVSQDKRFGLVGYHVCCPRCGYVTVALRERVKINSALGTPIHPGWLRCSSVKYPAIFALFTPSMRPVK